MARKGNPGLAANAQVTAGVQAQALEAHRSYLPTGDLSSMVAPVSRDPLPATPDNDCASTNFSFQPSQTLDALTKLRGVFHSHRAPRWSSPSTPSARSRPESTRPSWEVEASRSKESGQVADVDSTFARRNWGAKLAREMLSMLERGLGVSERRRRRRSTRSWPRARETLR